MEIGIECRVALTFWIVRIPLLREQVKRELDLAELFARKPLANHIADPGKDRAEDAIVVQNDLSEHDSHHRVLRIPTRKVGFASCSPECGYHVEYDAALLVARLTALGVDEQKHERPLRALAAPALQRDHPVKGFFAQHFPRGHTALRW